MFPLADSLRSGQLSQETLDSADILKSNAPYRFRDRSSAKVHP